MNARALFIGADGRARAPWRILLFLSLWVVCTVVVLAALAPVLVPVGALSGVPGTAEAIGMCISLLLAHAIVLRLVDRQGWSYVWLHRAAARPRAFAVGFGVGAAPIGLASALLLAVGWLAIEPAPGSGWLTAAAQLTLALLPAAFYEELFSRGYVFAALGEWLGRVVAIVFTSVAFGVLHMWNPGWTVGSIASVVLAGVLLAAVLLVTGSMYAAWMAHFAWNWVMATLLHVKVSGLTLPAPGYQTVDAGPDWATGGAWGPEGGAVAAAAMIATIVLLYLWSSRHQARRHDHAEPVRQSGSQEPKADVP